MEGGTLNSSVISFTQDDYNRLMDSNIFSSNKGERVFTIFPKDGGRHLAKYNPDKQYIFVIGKKDLSNPIVKWLSENSYISDNENYKLADGGTIDNQMENKLWYDIEKGIPHSFAKGGAISEGKAYGDWLITQYTPLTYDDLGGAHGGMIKLVNQDNFDTIIIWNDKALRSPKWSISYNNARIEDKNPSVVIEKVLKSYGNKKYYGGGEIGYENYIVEFKKGSETRRVGILAHSQQEAISKAKKMIGKGYSIGAIRRFAEGGGVGDEVYIEFLNKEKGFKKDVKYFKSYEEAVNWARKNFEKFNPDMIKHKFEKGGSCGCGSKFDKGGNTNCGCWHYEIGGL